ncbi:MAG: N-acetyltransferase [Gemmatimonadota bacterium]|nr:N-acetyltransferase [Gemmatimonadota bacterium]
MSLQITQLHGRAGVTRFIDVPWRLFSQSHGLWVPPLRAVVRDALDERRNPFYRNASRALFVAKRDGRPVGRIAAIENRRHNRHHGDRVGFFGFFDCADDPDAAAGLFARAEAWMSERGLDASRGPASPSMNHEAGVLVDGFDTPPAIMTPWNPPYYGALVEHAGYEPVKDLVGYDIPANDRLAVPERVRRLAERTARRSGVHFRRLDLNSLQEEARKALELYCQAWQGNWGFVPPGWDEFWHTARDLKRVIVPDVSFVAEVDGEMVGVMMVARDINQVLSDMPSGRLWPFNVVKLLTRISRVRRGRIVLLGLRADYRNRGLFPLFAYEAARRAQERGYEGAEASWILDDNEALIAPLEAMGLTPYKRWRMYERSIG